MIVLVQHDSKVPAGTFAASLAGAGVAHQTVALYRDDPLPPLNSVSGVILLGGYMGVYQDRTYPYLQQSRDYIQAALIQQTPLLGLCLGGQLLAQTLKARIYTGLHTEHGPAPVSLSSDGLHDPLFAGISSPFVTFQWHNDSFDLPNGAFPLAFSENCPCQAFRFGSAWGLQFHPEVDEESVAAWSRKDHGETILNDFRRQRSLFEQHAPKILDNFLAIIDAQS